MMNSLHPYPTYKPSGVPWLGDVPAHWEVRRTKTVLRERSEKGFSNQPLLAATQTKGVVRKEQYENRTVLALKDLHLLKLVRVGDFVISLRSFQGGIEYAREQGIISPAYTILHPVNPAVHAYLASLFKSRPYIENLTLHVTGIRQGQNIDYSELSRSDLPLPPLSEQRAIVRYLDYVNRRIRWYVAAKRKLIALLEEEKQAIVNRAVTRGLDPNVRLKPSGVDWLGDVSEHWEVVQLGRIGVFSKGSGGTKEDEVPDGIPCVRYGDLYTTHKYFVSQTRSYVSSERSSAYTPIDRGDVLFPTSGETIEEIGKSAVSLMPPPVVCGGDLIIFRPTIPIEPKFAGYALDCHAAQTQKSLMGRGITIMHIYSAQLKYLWLSLPPLPEQQAIVQYIDKATANIDTAIARTSRQIELVQEYRTRLIADVVTGKLDVREAAAQLPDEGDPLDEGGSMTDDMHNDLNEETELPALEEEVTA